MPKRMHPLTEALDQILTPWTKKGIRYYLNAETLDRLAREHGLVVTLYQSGNVSSCRYDGERVANRRAPVPSCWSVWWDAEAEGWETRMDEESEWYGLLWEMLATYEREILPDPTSTTEG